MEKVECIVVGGGLAGLAAAYGLARDGVEVMVLERGNYSGAKNVTGGRLYARALRHIFPELWDDAPFERPVAHELITLLGDGAATTVELASQRLAGPPPQSYTVQRARFDQWFADKATAAGAMVVTDMKADELLLDGDRVIGVRAGGDEVGADVTIVAEGVLGLLASGAGLREQPRPADHAVGFKEIIELPAGVIEDRWRLNEGEGAAQLFMGEVSRGMTGGGFLYTNRDSIALGVVVAMDQLRTRIDGLESWQLLDAFKETAQIKPLVRGGTLAEYSAHAVFEGGADRLPRPWGAGYLLAGETAGFALNALVTVRGMDLAIASGWAAARAALAARAAGDSSAATLSVYERFLRETFVTAAMQAGRGVPRAIENRRLFTEYPGAVARLLEGFFAVDEESQATLLRTSLRGARREFLKIDTLKDLWSLRKV
jgi:electron transfer flavoprotein-quinone oxidoreductase